MTTNAELMQRRRAAVSNGVAQGFEIFVDRAENSEIWDTEGKRYIDFAGGIAVLNTGHLHPHVIGAVKAQLDRYTHTCFQVLAYEPYVELAEKLNALMPGPGPKKTVFLSTGAEALENAVKIARAATGRPAIIAFASGYHGRTNLTLALTGKVAPYKVGFGPFAGDIHHALFPNELHGVTIDDAIDSVELLFKTTVEPSRVAAILLEPIQGEGGFVPAPAEFVRRLKEIADRHGILIIADEVQSGAGRTGTWYASEQWPVAPDILTTAKSLAGGFPLSAVTGRAELLDAAVVGGLGGTYAGSPIACAAALAVLEVFEKENLLQRAKDIGARLTERFKGLSQQHPEIVDVRGPGAMVAFELAEAGNPGAPDAALTKRIVSEAQSRGLILLSCGTYANVIRILVPLTASDELIEEGLDIIADSLVAATA
ncbi:4-aminobutyrate--2-oxoglutarate transaminase [Pseudochelatococcus contaminans]|uniref:4-aminobutyrate aminotransferase/(S)-3-amino-2-methylpropionate transaminase n=1 Tax=Pseudochelatococcus contaminans TaxID=1538103 RepID=A0A7W5Z753_9HYPH|nr:4-aminobutyrate--2-oxoglutarate transaminase [Pseudochelatococcus contaminans]MBB3811377.1 4-aminobutyrate aminotransferase/(S)-3-amino-2-methylpropionate transaminase [Pseudochelatococcus contaminans]